MTRKITGLILIGIGPFLLISGCEALYEAGVTGMAPFVDFEPRIREEEKHRKEYQEHGSPAALRWLLANRIQAGMSVAEVEKVLGQTATREFNDTWLKTKGGHYRSGDSTYKWGPDSEGRTLYLVFREGKLVNFNPRDYNDSL